MKPGTEMYDVAARSIRLLEAADELVGLLEDERESVYAGSKDEAWRADVRATLDKAQAIRDGLVEHSLELRRMHNATLREAAVRLMHPGYAPQTS